jgi:DNA-binding protein
MDAVEDYARRWIKREVDQDRTMRNHLSETLMLNDIQITSDYMSRWIVLKRRVGAVTRQRVLKVLLGFWS